MNVRAMAVLLAILGLAAAAGPAAARDWVALGMVHVPVRAYASPAAPNLATVRGGSYLQLTGQCTRFLNLSQISYMSAARQRRIVAHRWCEVSGPVHGWVYGGFMHPW